MWHKLQSLAEDEQYELDHEGPYQQSSNRWDGDDDDDDDDEPGLQMKSCVKNKGK